MKLEDLKPSPTQLPLVAMAHKLLHHSIKIIGNGEELHPMMHVITTGLRAEPVEVAVSIATLFTQDTEGIRRPALRELLSSMDAVAYVILSEAWTLTDDAAKKHDFSDRIANHPQRVSCVTLIGENIAGDTITAVFRIDEDKTPRVVSEDAEMINLFAKDENKYTKGRLTGLLT